MDIEPRGLFYSLYYSFFFYSLLTFIIPYRSSISYYYVDAGLICSWFNDHHLNVICRLLLPFLLHLRDQNETFFYQIIKRLIIAASCCRVLKIPCKVSYLSKITTNNLATSSTISSSSSLSSSLKTSSTSVMSCLLMCMPLSL